jgi:hypothetical protein
MGASVAEFDFGAHGGEQLARGLDVAHLRNVFENHRFVGEQSRRHARQRGVLRATDAHRAEQRVAPADYELIHVVLPQSPGEDRSLCHIFSRIHSLDGVTVSGPCLLANLTSAYKPYAVHLHAIHVMLRGMLDCVARNAAESCNQTGKRSQRHQNARIKFSWISSGIAS